MEKAVNNISKGFFRGCFYLLILYFSTSTFCLAQNSLLDQKVSERFQEKSLEDILQVLSEKYGLNFSFSADLIPLHEHISIEIENEPLEVFLSKIFEKVAIDYKILNNRIILKRKQQTLVQTIRGNISDEETQAPVVGASIFIKDAAPITGTISDKDGTFKIMEVPVGRQTLHISCVGYEPKVISNVLINSGKELVIDIKLKESILTMDEVVVHGAKDDMELYSDLAPVSARSFSVEETKRYAASFSDPARMASGFAGVTGNNDNDNALIIRGNSPRGLLWRIEGMEMPNPNHFANEGGSSGVINVLSANVLDNFELYTSAFPARFGNALSGVMDLSLRNGNNEKREHTFQAGLLGIEAATEGPFSNKGRSSYLVNYRYSSLNILDKMGFGLNEAGQYKDYQDLAFKFNFPIRKGGEISIYGIGGISKSDQENSSKIENADSDMGVTGITFKKSINEHTFIQSGLSLSGTNIKRYYDYVRPDSGFLKLQEQYIKTYARASFSIKRKINPNILLESGAIFSRLHYNFSLTDFNSDNPTYQVIRNFTENENGKAIISQAYSSISQIITPKLKAIYGMHFLHFGLTNDYSIEPRLSLNWQLNARQYLNFGAGKHSRVENLQYYLARNHQTGGAEIQRNRNLGFTRANHYVVGFTNLFGSGLKLNSEIYYQHIYNAPIQNSRLHLYSVINDDSGFITDLLNNKGTGRNYGVEVSLEKLFIRNFYFMMNGSVYQSKYSVGTEKEFNTIFNGNYNSNFLAGREFKVGKVEQNNTIGMNLKISSNGGRRFIPIDLDKSIHEGVEVADLEKAYMVRYPNYFRADLQLNYRKNKPGYAVEWRLDVQNFTNHLNPLFYYYSDHSKKVEVKHQLGWLPVLSYRIEF